MTTVRGRCILVVFLGISQVAFALVPPPVRYHLSDILRTGNSREEALLNLGFAADEQRLADAALSEAFTMSVGLLRDRAEQGDAYDQCVLGIRLRYGIEADIDLAEAVKWFRKAAASGVAEAQAQMADFYIYGVEVDQDFAKASHWNRRAAE